ncbi:hypothetical protein CD170_11120 [Staphylococcus aureus]|nr:hypothetical protein CD170_11120 [Staphylococcus aureus]
MIRFRWQINKVYFHFSIRSYTICKIKSSIIIKGCFAFTIASGVIVSSGLASEHSYETENNVMHTSANIVGVIPWKNYLIYGCVCSYF